MIGSRLKRELLQPAFFEADIQIFRLRPPFEMVRSEGLEPSACGLKVRCSTNWAKSAYRSHHPAPVEPDVFYALTLC